MGKKGQKTQKKKSGGGSQPAPADEPDGQEPAPEFVPPQDEPPQDEPPPPPFVGGPGGSVHKHAFKEGVLFKRGGGADNIDKVRPINPK
eukprot:SAG31_NODE_4394_length_3272_cov_1.708478_4_plen_89_part_00